MDLLGGIELLHAIPGRVRLRVPGIKGQPALAREVQKQLTRFKVVRRVEVSTLTASVLVLYDPADTSAMADLGRMIIPGLELDGMRAAATADPLTAGANGNDPPLPGQIADFCRRINTQVQAVTGGSDLRVVLPATLFAGGIVRLLLGKGLTSPQWYDYLWFSFGTFFTLNRAPAPEGTAAAPVLAPESESAVPANGTP